MFGAFMNVSSDFVASYLDAWNQHDPVGVAEHLAMGGTYCDVPTHQQLNRDKFVAHLKDYFSRDTNCYNLVGEVLTGEGSIAFQYRACQSGRTDKDAGWMGAEFLTMEGETASLIEDYYRDPALEFHNESQVMSSQRYEKSGLGAVGLKDLLDRLLGAMENEQAFLDSHLSLPDLASKLDCSINHLSQAINEGHGVSFFDFINRYRVEEATAILACQEKTDPSILDVALEVGFNSTSTFYSAFKKTTGQTPAQFRRESLKKG
jgi:AraC-like DNA-binding protein